MPKRTNEFQKLITRIYARLVPEGGRICESAMVKERDGRTEREVDVLLTHRAFGTELRIAVECHDRKRHDDIEWIDALIGKYKDLGVDRVIAVSASGFSRAAREKALANRIDALTLTEALETDWPAEFTRLRAGWWTGSFGLRSFTVLTRAALPFALTPETVIYTEAGDVFGTVGAVAHAMYGLKRDEINRSLDERLGEFIKTRDDFMTPVIAEVSVAPPSPLYLHGPNDQRHRAEELILRMQCSFATEEVEAKHYLFGAAGVTLATIPHFTGAAYSLLAVQSEDKPNAPVVHVEPIEPTYAKTSAGESAEGGVIAP